MPAKTRKAELRPAAKKAAKPKAVEPSQPQLEIVDCLHSMLKTMGASVNAMTELGKLVESRLPPPVIEHAAAVEPAVAPEPETEESNMPEEPPEWVKHAPITYELSCYCYTSRDGDQYGSNEGTVEQLDLSEDEYMALKVHLAKMRGYDVGSEPEPTDAK